jgi:hypothetical protein
VTAGAGEHVVGQLAADVLAPEELSQETGLAVGAEDLVVGVVDGALEARVVLDGDQVRAARPAPGSTALPARGSPPGRRSRAGRPSTMK